MKILRTLCSNKPGILSVIKQHLWNVHGHLRLLGGTCGFDLSHSLSNPSSWLNLTHEAVSGSTANEWALCLLWMYCNGFQTEEPQTLIFLFSHPLTHTRDGYSLYHQWQAVVWAVPCPTCINVVCLCVCCLDCLVSWKPRNLKLCIIYDVGSHKYFYNNRQLCTSYNQKVPNFV